MFSNILFLDIRSVAQEKTAQSRGTSVRAVKKARQKFTKLHQMLHAEKMSVPSAGGAVL